jgi:hypothetical protein
MNAQAQSIAGILVRELTTLKKEVEAYPSDADLWRLPPGISNSGGTLVLHLAGNLSHFVGGMLGHTGYVRQRDAEFSARGLSRGELVRLVDETIAAVERTFRNIGPAELAMEFPEPVAKVEVNTGDFLVHLVSHLAYHLGQVDYHRRLVTGNNTALGAVAPGRLRSAKPVV